MGKRVPGYVVLGVDGEPVDYGGYIYYIEVSGYIKIGYSHNWKARISALQRACPLPLTVLYIDMNSMDEEARLHQRFAKLRHRGEWFRSAPPILEHIEQLKSRQCKHVMDSES